MSIPSVTKVSTGSSRLARDRAIGSAAATEGEERRDDEGKQIEIARDSGRVLRISVDSRNPDDSSQVLGRRMQSGRPRRNWPIVNRSVAFSQKSTPALTRFGFLGKSMYNIMVGKICLLLLICYI
jgi:hypothetical protein